MNTCTIVALPHPPFLRVLAKYGTQQQTFFSAGLCVLLCFTGLLLTGSPPLPSTRLHQIDNRGETPAITMAVHMTAAPAYQEPQPEAEKLPAPKDSPSQAELATARREKQAPVISKSPPKPVQKTIRKKQEKLSPVTADTTMDTGEDKTTRQQSGGQAISPTHSATQGRDNQKAQDDYFNLLRQKIEEQKHYPRRARSAGQLGISEISFSLDNNGKPFSPKVTRSSGYELLDNAAIEAVMNVAAIGAPPPGAKREVTFSLRFQLNKGF